MRKWLTAAALCLASPVWAGTAEIVDHLIQPAYARLADSSAVLAAEAQTDCSPGSAPLQEAYNAAFDAWVGVSHLRFGPSETNDRAFALAFWPDPRSATPKALSALLRSDDPAIDDPAAFASVSIAARGFYALEFLLFDAPLINGADPAVLCRLTQAVTGDIARTSAAIRDGWQAYGELLKSAGSNETYRTPEEASRQLFTALSAGLEFTANARLGRPLGTFDRPRPKRAEARRSQRSLRHVELSLAALRPLALDLSENDPKLAALFDTAMASAAQLDDPVFAGVATPQDRLKVEALQQQVLAIRTYLMAETGPRLGIAAGFNSLDGD